MWRKCDLHILHILIILQLCSTVCSFNLNIKLAKVFVGNNPSSYFGYTTDFLITREATPKKWILVGAPRDIDQFWSPSNRTGALYKCDPENTSSCQQINIAKSGAAGSAEHDTAGTPIVQGRNNAWFGASLTVGDAVTVCSPRWVNKIEEKKVTSPMYYMNGVCYEIPRILDTNLVGTYALLSTDTSYSNPPNDKQQVNNTLTGTDYFHYQYGQMGMSVQYSKNNDKIVLIGAPGLRDAAGGLIEFNQNDVNIASESYDQERNNDYFGYALTTGNFLGKSVEYIALGGPRGNGTGQVKIVQMKGSQYVVKTTISGEETGSYFGSVLCAVDIEMTQSDVLVVGAPFYGNLTHKNIDINHINQDEGKVYVYYFDKAEGMIKELQQLKATGTNTKNSRFGSAICSPGDINKDGAMDLAVGAPYEDEGRGAVYIFNGHQGKFWPQPTQMIKGRSIGQNLMGFGLYLSQFKMDVDGNMYEDLLIGAPNSNRVVLLKSNPTISMEVSLATSLDNNVIQSNNEEFQIQVCFKYTGDQVLPVDVTVKYTVGIDNEMTKDRKRERVLASNGSNIVEGTKKVIRSLSTAQCSQSYDIVVQQYRTDIVTPVTFIVRYAIIQQAGTGQDCNTTPCPVINVFNANRQIPDADFFEQMINFSRPGCGDDNICKTDLSLQVNPIYNYGSLDTLIRGPEAGFQLEITVSNLKEGSYGTILTVDSENHFVSYMKVESSAGSQSQVSCSPQNIEDDTKSVLECSLSDLEVPFVTGKTEKFTIYFDASGTQVIPNFNVNVNLKTRSIDINMSNNKRVITMKVESKADIVFEGVGDPELYVTSKTKGDKVTHRYDFTNNGPSVLTSASTFSVSYPSVIINTKALLQLSELNFVVPVESSLDCGTDISLKIVTIGTDNSGTNSTRTYQLVEKNAILDDNLNYNCKRGYCRKIECKTAPLGVKSFVTILLKYTMDPGILAQVQSKSRIDSLLILSVATTSMPTDLLLSSSLSHSAMAKTDVVPAEQIKKEVAWWVVLLGILAGLIVLGIVAGIFWKLGFFRRKHQEEIAARKKSQHVDPKGDEENLIQNNGKDQEKEPIEDNTEEANKEIPNDTSSI